MGEILRDSCGETAIRDLAVAVFYEEDRAFIPGKRVVFGRTGAQKKLVEKHGVSLQTAKPLVLFINSSNIVQ
ncbi:hypothetical protein M948_10465 [Virgibacillus sp. CM-4]|nr:hypothetical protein M948_10465 [Virgibacillus sp. CM-4]